MYLNMLKKSVLKTVIRDLQTHNIIRVGIKKQIRLYLIYVSRSLHSLWKKSNNRETWSECVWQVWALVQHDQSSNWFELNLFSALWPSESSWHTRTSQTLGENACRAWPTTRGRQPWWGTTHSWMQVCQGRRQYQSSDILSGKVHGAVRMGQNLFTRQQYNIVLFMFKSKSICLFHCLICNRILKGKHSVNPLCAVTLIRVNERQFAFYKFWFGFLLFTLMQDIFCICKHVTTVGYVQIKKI